MYFVHSIARERFYLRILLNVVCGATSFENLCMVKGILYHSFKEACIALDLLQNDKEWNQCLKKVGHIKTRTQLRNLFATILLFCEPVRPEILWQTHISTLSDDILFQTRHDTGNMTLELTNTDIHDKALQHLQIILNKHGRRLDQFPDMPIPTALPNNNNKQDNQLIREKQQYNIEELAELTENGFSRLNVDQRAVFEEVVAAVETKTPNIFFVDSPGGTGKTFLYK